MSAVAKTIRVLVGYASRFGSTRDIATRIGDAVRTGGSEVDVRSVDDISDVDRYDAKVWFLFKALGRHAGDNRHWPDIDAWAEKIARASNAVSESSLPRRAHDEMVLMTARLFRSQSQHRVDPRRGCLV